MRARLSDYFVQAAVEADEISLRKAAETVRRDAAIAAAPDRRRAEVAAQDARTLARAPRNVRIEFGMLNDFERQRFLAEVVRADDVVAWGASALTRSGDRSLTPCSMRSGRPTNGSNTTRWCGHGSRSTKALSGPELGTGQFSRVACPLSVAKFVVFLVRHYGPVRRRGSRSQHRARPTIARPVQGLARERARRRRRRR